MTEQLKIFGKVINYWEKISQNFNICDGFFTFNYSNNDFRFQTYSRKYIDLNVAHGSTN